jgi:hypothetical protein
MSPTSPLAVGAIGIAPAMTAEWTNGIHATTLYANVQREVFPTDAAINTLDGQAGFTQKYEMFRDLIFTVKGNYSHQTIAPGLQNGIPSPISSPSTIVLPNGDTQLPNGTIVSPTGQVVGQAAPALTVGTQSSIVNPYDVFTGTASVDKYFNRGIITLSTSYAGTTYEMPGSADFQTRSFTGSGAFWLSPVFYAYANGAMATTFETVDSTGFRAVGGFGFRLDESFGGSVYFGRQGSEGSGTAGGDVFGGRLSYKPTPVWTIGLSFDETINIASQSSAAAPPSNLALTLPVPIPLQIPQSSSTQIASTFFNTQYAFSPEWTATGNFGYTRIEYLGSPRLDLTWLADVTLSYSLSRMTTLTWEYQYSSIVSNAPQTSTSRNYVTMGASYKF